MEATQAPHSAGLRPHPSLLGEPREIFRNFALILTGNLLNALCINGVLIPFQFLSGGLTGLVLGIAYLVPWLGVSVGLFLLNVPIFALGYRFVGRRFFVYSIVGMVSLVLMVEWVTVPLPVTDPILAAVLAGILMGAGSGLVLKSRGSGGGTDVLSVILLNRFSIKIGSTFLGFNVVVLLIAAFTVSLDAALFTLIYMYVTSNIIDVVVTGMSRRRAILIISRHPDRVAREILYRLKWSVTFLRAEGAYSGEPEKLIYTVVTIREMARVKSLVRRTDPDAIVVISDTLEVVGQRVGNQPHW
ncbi:MAG: YitT family protein [Desulfococcaceae bacterium]